MVSTANEYEFEVTDDVPPEPDKLFTKSQLADAVAKHVPNDVEVSVNTRFRRTVVRVNDRDKELEVSWYKFREENQYGGDGWAVVMSAVEAVGY